MSTSRVVWRGGTVQLGGFECSSAASARRRLGARGLPLNRSSSDTVRGRECPRGNAVSGGRRPEMRLRAPQARRVTFKSLMYRFCCILPAEYPVTNAGNLSASWSQGSTCTSARTSTFTSDSAGCGTARRVPPRRRAPTTSCTAARVGRAPLRRCHPCAASPRLRHRLFCLPPTRVDDVV